MGCCIWMTTISRYNIKQSNVAPIACRKIISHITSIVQHHHIKTNIINLISSSPWLWRVGQFRCKHLVLMSPPACPAARSPPPLILPCVPKDQHLAAWSMALWEVMHVGKESTPTTNLLIPSKCDDSLPTHRTYPLSDHLVR
jgi:hypothetical protein